MPKIIKIDQCFTELFDNNSGMVYGPRYVEDNTVFE